MSRVEDKVGSVEEFISELIEVIPENCEEYKSNTQKRLASERAFEKIIEAVNDLAILFVKEKNLQIPREDEHAFDILQKAGHISGDLSKRLKQAKGMRNVLAHQYDNISDEIIFEALESEIIKDTREFLSSIKNKL